MATFQTSAVPGYQFEAVPDLSRLETRERLSQSAIDGLFGELLGGVPRSSLYKLRTAAGTLRVDELTRISCVVGIYKALHILLPAELADRWMIQPNDNSLFGGQSPIDYAVRLGIPGLLQIRGLLDAARGGQ
jgi:hypothetical protein